MNRPALLAEPEIQDALAALPGWELEGDALVRTFTCADFPGAIAFVVQIGFAAEALNHHPDLDVRWRSVRVACTTHDVGGLTERDVSLAGAVNDAFAAGD